jgi:phosphinothricin acetyltransferase
MLLVYHIFRYNGIMVRSVKKEDASAICSIYNHYVRETAITFEEVPVSINEMEGRIRTINADYPWFVFDDGVYITGFAYVSKWKERSAYRFSAEITVYIKEGHEGKGIGTELYNHLIEAARKKNIHALVAGIALPNERSIALHEKFGFTKIAQFNEIGFKQDKWIDVGYWELVL